MKFRKQRALSILAASAMAATGSITMLSAPPGANAVAPPQLHLNEVIQDNDAIADAVELYNAGATSIDLGGWIIADDKNQMILDAGTQIAPGQYLMITVDDDARADKFGLGKADEVSIRMPDGTTIIDRFAWDGHVSTSYARCPDLTGPFTPSIAATPGAANLCDAPALGNVLINEIESDAPDGGGDWVELVNTSGWNIDLADLTLANTTTTPPYTFAAGATLNAGALLVVKQSQLGFELGSNDRVRFSDGSTIIDEFAWTAHALHTFGRCPSGVGEIGETAQPTKGAPNVCPTITIPPIVVNEVETSDGNPGDWIELKNLGSTAIDLSGWVVRDNDDAHVSVISAGTTIAAGGYYVVEETQLGFGLGKADSARLYLPGGHTLVNEYTWTATDDDEHAPTTFGRCEDGTGTWTITTAPTKGAANDCSAPVRINEIESKDDNDGPDWVELVNVGFTAYDVSGMTLTDASDNGPVTLPAGTTIEAGGYLVVETEPVFGLGGNDELTLRDANGTQLDTVSWTSHAAPTLGRCADGTGPFGNTREATPGAANACTGDLIVDAWPGTPGTSPVDIADTFGADMSGVAWAADGRIWAVNNGNGTLHLLEFVNGVLVEAAGWEGGRTLRYPDGTGTVDAEGVALIRGDASNGVLVSSERNTGGSDRGSRPSVLRYEVGGGSARNANAELIATHEWNLAADYPGIGANAGVEGIAWVADATLVAGGLVDQITGLPYNPAQYPAHQGGVVFVAVEASPVIAGYVLGEDGSLARITEFATDFPGVMELEFDTATGQLWALCDDACEGRTQVFALGSGEHAGTFVPVGLYERPAETENIANEGFALAPASTCTTGQRQVIWADDAQTDGHAFRLGSLDCVDGGAGPGTDPGTDPGTGTPDTPDTGTAHDGSSQKPSGSAAPATLSTTGGADAATIAIWAALALAAAGGAVLVAQRGARRQQ